MLLTKMNIKDQVVSLELAKELKGLGVKQASVFYWWESSFRVVTLLYNPLLLYREEGYSAYTVAELGEMLPKTIDKHSFYIYKKDDEQWFIYYFNDYYRSEKFRTIAKTEAETRAKLLISLIKEGIIKAGYIK